ncbi:hypothetical protein MOKP122_47300 [Mycobacterium avium subsp. hominissuis]
MIKVRSVGVRICNADRGGLAVLSQVDGARWLSLEGRSKVNSDADAVRDAELRYASATARRGPTRDGWSSKCKSSGCSGRRIYWTGARKLLPVGTMTVYPLSTKRREQRLAVSVQKRFFYGVNRHLHIM